MTALIFLGALGIAAGAAAAGETSIALAALLAALICGLSAIGHDR